ncbi:MAG: hypothetical protein ACI8S6_001350 [Myxococcota bacterium]|jgi:hypothetical protein
MMNAMNTEMRKQATRMLDLNHKTLSWQLEQTATINSQLREQGDAITKMTLDSVKLGFDNMLAAQRAMLDAFAPKTDA